MSVREVIAQLFFDGKKDRATDTIKKLNEQGRLQIIKRGLPRGYSYYQLTAKACAEVGVSEERAEPLKAQGLARSLGVLWFATMSSTRRTRLRNDKLPDGLPPVPGRPPHVAEVSSKDSGRIYRVHVPGEKKDHLYPLAQIREVIDEIATTGRGEEFIRSGAYAFAILVHDEEKKLRFEEAIEAQRATLKHDALVIVETAPSPGSFPLYIK